MSDKVAKMRLPDGLSALILEATDQGYDVTITVRLRDDGAFGRVLIPIPWARRLGMTNDQIDAAKNDQSWEPHLWSGLELPLAGTSTASRSP